MTLTQWRKGMRPFAPSFAPLRPFRPVRAESAAAFRIAFGVLGLAAVVRFAANGWIDGLYIEPARRFAYSGFWWVQPLPEWGMFALFALIGVAAACVALGLLYRAAIIAFFALFTYVELIDKTTYLNHYYLISLLAALMIFLPLGGLASADAAIARRRGRRYARQSFISAWVVWALRAQVGAVYLFGGIAKLDSDWLLNAQPLRIWLRHSADLPLVGPALLETWAAYAMSWGGTAFDLSIVGFLLWRRSRPFAYAALAAFHLATWVLFPAIGMFPLIMICLSTIFFPPNWPSALWRRVRRRPIASATSAAGGSPSWRWSERLTAKRKMGLAIAAVVALAQIAVPLRHFAYPGDARWNEDGARFSWRVMLTERTGHVRFRARDAATGEEWLEYPDDYLTPLQAERMAHQPDMILAAARMIAERWRGEGRAVEVRADAFVTVNGRRAARFIDPDADLASVQPGVLPKRWVLDAPWR